MKNIIQTPEAGFGLREKQRATKKQESTENTAEEISTSVNSVVPVFCNLRAMSYFNPAAILTACWCPGSDLLPL